MRSNGSSRTMKTSLLDPATDNVIRHALHHADVEGKLPVVAAVVGIAGGEPELRKIMNSSEELSIMDRGILALHLELI
jgi:hypothetical protein